MVKEKRKDQAFSYRTIWFGFFKEFLKEIFFQFF